MIRVIVVGRHNVCASALAELILREDLERFGVEVASAGIDAVDDDPLDAIAMRLGEHYGIDQGVMDAHSARALDSAELATADLILTLTRSQRDVARAAAPERAAVAFTLREFERLARSMTGPRADPAPSASGDGAARLRPIVASLHGRRPSDPVDDEDLDDESGDYEQMWMQLLPALAEISRLVETAADVR